MNKKIKIVLNNSELQSLLHVFSTYNVFSIQNRNSRYMVAGLIGKLHIKLTNLAQSDKKKHSINLSGAQAAAFDEAFVQTPVLVRDYHLDLYEELLIDRIVYEINSQL